MTMWRINRYLALYLFLVLSQVGYAQEEQDDFFYRGASVKRELVRYENSVMVCDTLDDAIICIYNIENEYWGKDQQFTDDTKWTKAMLLGKKNLVVYTTGQARHMMTIVDNAFTEEMAAQLNRALFMVTVHINSLDGTVAGVGFMFDKGDEYETIPIGVYAEIEDEIKNNLVFELTPLAQKLNFNQLSWLQCPTGRAEEVPEEKCEQGIDNNSGLKTELGGVITDRGTIGSVGGNGLLPTIGGQMTP